MHDVENLARKIKDIDESLALVEERLPETYEDFASLDVLVKDGIFKRIEFIIERMFDTLFLICKLKGYVPNDDMDCVRYLEEKGVLSSEISEKLRLMKGFRNILVHRYGNLDERLSFENIRSGLKDIHAFLDLAKKELENLGKG